MKVFVRLISGAQIEYRGVLRCVPISSGLRIVHREGAVTIPRERIDRFEVSDA